MNAGKRWAYHFVSGLECVDCRRKGDLTLYRFDDTIEKVDSDDYTPWELKELVPHMDVWCSACEPRVTWKVTGEGRLAHKEEAARMADIRFDAQRASIFDTYRIEGADVSRYELVERLKQLPCAQCHGHFPTFVMELYHPSKKLSSVQEILDNHHEAVVVCGNCKKMLEHGLFSFPQSNITLDENFWSSLKTI